jgi:peptide deformylase
MKEQKIKFYGDPILRKKCQKVEKISQEVREFAQNMLQTMYQEEGVGLAAPQIGDQRRIIVVDIGQGPLSLVNPQIITKSLSKEKDYEGCLSLPGLNLKIKRSREVTLEGYLLEKNQKVQIKAKGLLARDFQHEIDHLDGILMIDHVSPFKKIRAIKKLKKFLKKHKV